MKKPHIDMIEIIIRGEKNHQFVGPKDKLRPLLHLLAEYDFTLIPKSKEPGVPWRMLAADRIKKYTMPGLALRGARIKENMSQLDLAAKLGIPQYNISKMENGKRSIGKKMAKRISKILNIDYRIFL